ncbi:MAG: DNA alkylation repair protein [Acidobacteria bacterium]|nr:DNA alkylation repair protein [Acidobacteriota bacterium]
MHPYVKAIKALFEQNADRALAPAMKRYMRDQFEYLGIKTPQRGALLKELHSAHPLPGIGELDGVLRELWALPEREFQYAGIALLGRFERQLPAGFAETLQYLVTDKSWWDTVDGIAAGAVGAHFDGYPAVRRKVLARWRKAENFWLRRTTLLFQLNYREDTDFDLLCALIRENLGSREFFINKAIGWALRQYARTDRDAVRRFVAAHPDLHPLSRREATKHL